MCLVSVMTQQIPNQVPNWPQQFNLGQLTDLSLVLQRLDRIDKALNLRDCHDAEKQQFLDTLAARIKVLETQKARRRSPRSRRTR